MDTPTPNQTPSSRSAHDADLRRTSRIERSVPLLILGTNRRGEAFQEKTYAIAVNLHGCRYVSRHEYAPASWITLQVTGADGGNSTVVRARVRSVVSARTPRELFQVGVELETPGNVWGISSVPLDWRRFLGTSSSTVRSEVTVFPGPPASTSAITASAVSFEKDAAPKETERVAINAEQLQELQIAADKAVQVSLSTRVDEAVKVALGKIEEGSRARLRETQEASARLAEIQSLWEKESVSYRNRAEEIAQRIETVTANSQQALSDTQKFVARFAGETAPQLQTRINESFGRAGTEFEARAAQISDQHLAEISQNTQLAAREARSQLDESIAEVRSLLSAAGGGVSQERVESLFHSLREETFNNLEARLADLYRSIDDKYDMALHRIGEVAREVEGLGSETRQARSRHEQELANARSLLAANANAGVPQERLDSLLNSSREQIVSLLEWRLGEVSGHHEQLLGQTRNRADELAQQLERLSAETRDHLSETRNLAERASEVRSLDLASIEQSLFRATKEFENLAARVSDRQLVRLTEQKQVLSQEVALELEARTSEARALLQKAANNSIEEFRRRVEGHIDLVLAEAKEGFISSLASLDAESRASVEARREVLEADVARAAEQCAMEFRSGLKAFLNSCLVAAVGAVDQHAQTTLAGFSIDPSKLPNAPDTSGTSSTRSDDPPSQPNQPFPSR
jgi:hypothetical protein